MRLTNEKLLKRLTRGQNRFKERNIDISVDVLDGMTLKKAGIGRGYYCGTPNLSGNRVRDIVRGFCFGMNRLYFLEDNGISQRLTLREMRENKHMFLDDDFLPKLKDLEQLVDIFDTRTSNCLKREDIYTLSDLLLWSEVELLKTPDLGAKSTQKIKAQLAERGFQLRNGNLPR
jgi:hypothetical protein